MVILILLVDIIVIVIVIGSRIVIIRVIVIARLSGLGPVLATVGTLLVALGFLLPLSSVVTVSWVEDCYVESSQCKLSFYSDMFIYSQNAPKCEILSR